MLASLFFRDIDDLNYRDSLHIISGIKIRKGEDIFITVAAHNSLSVRRMCTIPNSYLTNPLKLGKW